ncbi:MAG: hypothetical protein M3Y71_07650, partial [Actinomycetota bacterium]|nr:hypothetical protein [Actinomycetota bacterium]
MSGDDHLVPPGRDPEDADPVADFFATEREQVRPLSDGDVRWQRITREHRTRGGSWRRYAAAAAAVVVVGAGVGLVTSLRHQSAVPASQPAVTRTVYVPAPATSSTRVLPPAPAPAPPTTATAPSTTGTAVPSRRLPDDFTVLSLTTVASGRMFVLGSASCGGQPCTLLATSSGSGATWSLRGRVPGVRAAARVSAAASPADPAAVGSGSGVTDVRFASDTVGWVFGRTVLRTADGGRSWAPYAHGGRGPVLALETDGSDVVLAAAASCTAPSCTGAVSVSRAAVEASAATVVGSPLLLGQGYLGLDIAWRQQTAVVSVRAGSQDPPASAVRGSAVTALAQPDCANASRASTVAAPADGSGLVLLCG